MEKSVYKDQSNIPFGAFSLKQTLPPLPKKLSLPQPFLFLFSLIQIGLSQCRWYDGGAHRSYGRTTLFPLVVVTPTLII
jgi:hypothetical protein